MCNYLCMNIEGRMLDSLRSELEFSVGRDCPNKLVDVDRNLRMALSNCWYKLAVFVAKLLESCT